MKISLWQQFSSNHSADFTVVGVFQTIDEAKAAVTLLRDELVKIASWFEDLANKEVISERIDRPDYTDRQLLPPEKELDAKYGTGFTYAPTDWLWYSDEADGAVVRFENIVFISNHLTSFRTWSGKEPFEKLMEAVGGTVGCDCMVVTCKVPSAETAKTLYNQFILRKKEPEKYFYLPYLDLAPFCAEPDSEILKLIFFNDGDIWEDLRKLRELLKTWQCENIQYQVFRDCDDAQ